MTYVQLIGDAVTAIFSCDQDPGVWPNVVSIEDDDPRLNAYWERLEVAGGKRPIE
jgi:hypothetical protein